MSKIEPTAVAAPPARKLCPICGKPAYSRGGIHPQCAMVQADEPRAAKLRTAKQAETAVVEKPRARTWKKKCPECGNQQHTRRDACKCGHKFN